MDFIQSLIDLLSSKIGMPAEDSLDQKLKEFEKSLHHKPCDANTMLAFIDEARMHYFSYLSFYKILKSGLANSSTWSLEQKQQFVDKVIWAFQGTAGWDTYNIDDWDTIFIILKMGRTPLECLNLIVKSFADIKETARIQYVLAEVERIKRRRKNPIYLRPKNEIAEGVVFKDVGLQIAVINQLMFNTHPEKRLQPIFDLTLFSEEYEERFICHYGGSREAGKYLRHLAIPHHYLEGISRLTLDINADLYAKIALDDYYVRLGSRQLGTYIPLKEKALDDLAYLPNLEEIIINWDISITPESKIDVCPGYFLEREKLAAFSVEMLEKLKARGIKVIQNRTVL